MFYAALVGAVARFLLAWSGVGRWLAWRIEVSTAANSNLELREGLALFRLGVSPYIGSTCRTPPLALWLYAGLADHGLLYVLSNMILDILTALILHRLAVHLICSPAPARPSSVAGTSRDASPSHGWSRGASILPSAVAWVYLLNPFTLAASAAGTTSSLESLAVVGALYGASTRRPALAALSLAAASYICVHAAVLLLPVACLLSYGPEDVATPLRLLGPASSNSDGDAVGGDGSGGDGSGGDAVGGDPVGDDGSGGDGSGVAKLADVGPEADGQMAERGEARESLEGWQQQHKKRRRRQRASKVEHAAEPGGEDEPDGKDGHGVAPAAAAAPSASAVSGAADAGEGNRGRGASDRAGANAEKASTPAQADAGPEAAAASAANAGSNAKSPGGGGRGTEGPVGTATASSAGPSPEVQAAAVQEPPPPPLPLLPWRTLVRLTVLALALYVALLAASDLYLLCIPPPPGIQIPSLGGGGGGSGLCVVGAVERLAGRPLWPPSRMAPPPPPPARQSSLPLPLQVQIAIAARDTAGEVARRLAAAGDALASCWAVRVYGSQVLLDDATPNLGQWWYLTMEVFDDSKVYIRLLAHSLLFALAPPLAIRLGVRRPLALFIIQMLSLSLLKPYPSVADLGLCAPLLLLLGRRQLAAVRLRLLLPASLALLCVLGPAMQRMWLSYESANSNFLYSITLMYGVWQVVLLGQVLGLTLRVDRVARGKERLEEDGQVDGEVKPATADGAGR